MNPQVAAYVKQYQMLEHPEGGYYKETWRSESVLNTGFLPAYSHDKIRNLFTSILFLLPGTTFSALHRIKSEELWNYHSGDPVIIYEIVDGRWQETILGPGTGQTLQHVVLPGHWFASRSLNSEGYTLCGCTVVPGFDFEDFEMAGFQELSGEFPLLSDKIRRLTRLP